MRNALILLVLCAAATAVVAQPYHPDSTRKAYSDDMFGIGLCLAKGAGALGGYAYLRPVDNFGLEITGGKRLFILLNGNTGEAEILWPYMFTGSAQFYFSGRQARTQFGMELGGVIAEDAGPGGEVAGTLRYRMGRNVNLDMNLGLGAFMHQKESTLEYFVKTYGTVPDWYSFSGPPVFLMWGLGLSIAF